MLRVLLRNRRHQRHRGLQRTINAETIDGMNGQNAVRMEMHDLRAYSGPHSLSNPSRTGQRVCLLGCSLTTGNRGVSALAVSLIRLILDSLPEARISLLVGEKHGGWQSVWVSGRPVKVEIINFRLSPHSRFHEHLLCILLLAVAYRFLPLRFVRRLILKRNKWLSTVVHADFVGDIRGGDGFSDIYGIGQFIIGCIPAFIVTLLRSDLVLLPQTFGPYKHRVSRLVARLLICRAKSLIVRDRASIAVIHSVLPERRKEQDIVFCPDVAFVLESKIPSNPVIAPPMPNVQGRRIIGLNVSGLLYNGGCSPCSMFGLAIDYRHFIFQLIDSLVRDLSVDVLLIPHSIYRGRPEESDDYAIKLVTGDLPPEYSQMVHVLKSEHDQSEVKAIIGMCDYFIGSRMHSCIAALSQGIPTIGVAYSDKFTGIFESVGLARMVFDARKASSVESLVESILERCNSPWGASLQLSTRLLSIRKHIYRVTSQLLREAVRQ